MRNLKLSLAVVPLVALLSSNTFAAPPLKLLGMEDMSCATWKKQTDPELRESYIQWVRGFLSGHNYANQNMQVAEVSTSTVAVFIDRYCAEHSKSSVAEAAMRMSDQYSGRNTPITR